MPSDHPPTQPAPMSEDELKDFEQRAVKERNAAMREIVPISRWTFALWLDDFLGVVAEVRRLQAAVTEESKRADRAERVNANQLAWVKITNEWCESEVSRHEAARKLAEAAARELREKLMVVGGESLIKYQPEIEALLASTAWLTGGNEQPITEEGKGNGK